MKSLKLITLLFLFLNSFSYAQYVQTLAGSGTAGTAIGNGINAEFNQPAGMAVDATGNVFLADQLNHVIKRITPSGDVSIYAGTGNPGGSNGALTSAEFNFPTDIAISSTGDIYVADWINNQIRKIDVTTQMVSTFAGSTSGYADGAPTTAQFNRPSGIAFDASGNLIVADLLNNRIRTVDASGNVGTIAGNGNSGAIDGTGVTAEFYYPFGVAIHPVSGDIYVSDGNTSNIRKIVPAATLAATTVDTYAGIGMIGDVDGNISVAAFSQPSAMEFDGAGNLYIADYTNHKIKKIDLITSTVFTYAGTGAFGYADGTPSTAQFYAPYGLTIDSNNGNIYVSERNGHKVRTITACNLSRAYVDQTATGNGDGASWANAFTDLQAAINAVCSNGEVWIKGGTYIPNKDSAGNSNPADDRKKNFYINQDGIQLLGGFNGTETTASDRDWAVNPTIFSGDIGTTGVNSDNTYHILNIDGTTNGGSITSNTIISGIVFQDGMADGLPVNGVWNQGAGIYLNGSSPTISNCAFRNNECETYGAAISSFTEASQPTIYNCVFFDNIAGFGGSAYACRLSAGNPNTISNCTFYRNVSTSGGGAINLDGNTTNENFFLENCIFWDNGTEPINYSGNANYILNNCIVDDGTFDGNITFQFFSISGNNNFDSDPLFIDAANPAGADNIPMTADDGLNLQFCSPAIDEGSAITAPITNDILGIARTVSSDLGAYESVASSTTNNCTASSPLPATTGRYRSRHISPVDANGWTHYCDCNNNLLASFKLAGTGAAIPSTGVGVDIKSPLAEHYPNGTGFVTNPNGAAFFTRKLEVYPDVQPSSPVDVRFYFTNNEYNELNNVLTTLGQSPLTGITDLSFYKVTNPAINVYPNVSGLTFSDIAMITNHPTVASTNQWIYGAQGADHYAEYQVASFSPTGGGGGADGGGTVPVESLETENVSLELFPNPSSNGMINLNYYSLENTELNVSILDITGKKLLNKNIQVSEKMNHFQLNLSSLNKGIYIVQFGDQKNSISRKLILE